MAATGYFFRFLILIIAIVAGITVFEMFRSQNNAFRDYPNLSHKEIDLLVSKLEDLKTQDEGATVRLIEALSALKQDPQAKKDENNGGDLVQKIDELKAEEVFYLKQIMNLQKDIRYHLTHPATDKSQGNDNQGQTKQEPKKEEPKKQEPKKEEPKKVEPKPLTNEDASLSFKDWKVNVYPDKTCTVGENPHYHNITVIPPPGTKSLDSIQNDLTLKIYANKTDTYLPFYLHDSVFSITFSSELTITNYKVGVYYKEELLAPQEEFETDDCIACNPLLNVNTPWANHYYIADKPSTATVGFPNAFIIKPFSFTKKVFPNHYKTASFIAILRNTTYQQPLGFIPTQEFDEGLGGWRIQFTPMDPGKFHLVVKMISSSGTDADDNELPIMVSSHMQYTHSWCDDFKSQIQGSRAEIIVDGVAADLDPTTSKKCTKADLPGRWFWRDKSLPCVLPLCSGDRKGTKSMFNWNGQEEGWIWKPLGCHLHLYDKTDLSECSKETKIEWIHVVGDSPVRELASNIIRLHGVRDWTKFEQANLILDVQGQAREKREEGFHISFLFPGHMMAGSRPMTRLVSDDVRDFNQYQVLTKNESLNDRPDVFAFNPALAYATGKMTWKSYKSWLDEFVSMWESKFDKKIKPFWVRYPFSFGQAHPSTTNDWISAERENRFSRYAEEQLVNRLGWEVVDLWLMSTCKPENAWDGLHYSREGNGEWEGHTSQYFMQVFLNAVYPSCSGSRW